MSGSAADTGVPVRSDRIARGRLLIDLHAAPELLLLVNVWDVATARVVAAEPGVRAIATASHAIAAAFGFPDGEAIPLDLVLDMTLRIVAAVDLPVTADLEAGYGDAGETVRRAIDAGVVGANLEDRMDPIGESVGRVRAAVSAAEAAGVPFAVNARTDAFLVPPGRGEPLTEALERGHAFLAEGATSVFVPGDLDEATIETLVDGFGPGRLALIAPPASVPLQRLQELGVARVSLGPWPQRVALAALASLTAEVVALRAGVPVGTPPVT